MNRYDDIELHGTPAGYKAGCKTDQMCADGVPWTCRRAIERYRGDYAYHRRVDEGLTPDEIHTLELQEAEAWAAKPAPAKPVKKKPKRTALAEQPDRLTAYGPAAANAKHRIASTPDTPTTSPAALAASPSKDVVLPDGVERREPPARAFRRGARGGDNRNLQLMAAMRATPGEWLCLGVRGKDAVQRWRHGKIAGTVKGEFEAVIDLPTASATKGEVFVRYVGKEN